MGLREEALHQRVDDCSDIQGWIDGCGQLVQDEAVQRVVEQNDVVPIAGQSGFPIERDSGPEAGHDPPH